MIKECKQCGACCRLIAFGMAYGGAEWNEYYHVRGCRVEPGVGLLVPSICPHLQQHGDRFECDIYEKRPALCRLSNKNTRFYKPPGCTDEMG